MISRLSDFHLIKWNCNLRSPPLLIFRWVSLRSLGISPDIFPAIVRFSMQSAIELPVTWRRYDVMCFFLHSMCGWLISICLTFGYNDFDSPNNYWKTFIIKLRIRNAKLKEKNKMKIMYSSRWKRHDDQPTHAHSENFSRCNDEHILLLKLHSAHFQWICKSIFVNENVGKNCIIVCVQNHFSEVWLQVKTEWQKSSSDRTEAPCFYLSRTALLAIWIGQFQSIFDESEKESSQWESRNFTWIWIDFPQWNRLIFAQAKRYNGQSYLTFSTIVVRGSIRVW